MYQVCLASAPPRSGSSSQSVDRCPTECRLSYSPQAWSCKVSLRKTFDGDGRPMGTAENIPFGSVIRDKGQVEERIRRAQRAILRPSQNPEVFLKGPDEDLDYRRELTFSKNCVSLEISGPELTDLSFCDLPGMHLSSFLLCYGTKRIWKGLIASVGQGGNTSDIDLVKDLVTTYICKPSCLILLTVTCESKPYRSSVLSETNDSLADFENQGAHTIARQHDPQGKRTIGLLTSLLSQETS